MAVLATGWSRGAAKSEAWKDADGNRFRGEPAEVMGPFALFSTSSTSGRRAPLHLLAPDDCVRFHEQVKTKPARASDWADAGGVISRELPGRVMRVAGVSEEARMSRISWFVPGDGYGIVIVNRDGVPLFSSGGENQAAVKKVMDELASLLQLMSPGNPASWKDRAYYLRAIQPTVYARGQCDPVLVGDPLRADALKQRGVSRFEADIQVAADGRVSSIAIKPGGELPADLGAPIAEALKQAVFVPAVRDGKWVPGTYAYRFAVPR